MALLFPVTQKQNSPVPRTRSLSRFEKDLVDGRTSYSIVAYATVYQYFAYPDKIRPRIRYVWNEHLHLEGHAPVHTIYHRCLFGSFLHAFRTSQFLVLPPFQRKGHGGRGFYRKNDS